MIRKALNKTHEGRQYGVSFVFACLLVLTLSTALAVVSVSHKSRQQVGVLERLNTINTAYLAQSSRLKLEFSTLAEFGRVEKSASNRLGMIRISAVNMVVSP